MEDKKEQLWFFFQFLHEVEKSMSQEEEKKVMIEKAINLRLLCDYVVSCSYGDMPDFSFLIKAFCLQCFVLRFTHAIHGLGEHRVASISFLL